MALAVAAPPKHLLQVADFTRGQLEDLLGLATRMKTDPLGWRNTHAGRTLACFLREPSTRTRVSLEVAAQRLGMLPLMLRSDELQIGRGEPTFDTARLLSAYVDAVAVAGLAQVDLQRLSTAAAVPVINAQSEEHNPCQALADLLTIKERFGRIEGLKLAYVGGATDIAHSLMQASALFGMDFTLANACGCRPHAEVLIRAHALAERCGGSVELVADPDAAVRRANVVYADAGLHGHQVTADLMALAAHDAIFMHRLPAQRGAEVAAAVIDGPSSAVFQQAANRLPTQQALIHTLMHTRTQAA